MCTNMRTFYYSRWMVGCYLIPLNRSPNDILLDCLSLNMEQKICKNKEGKGMELITKVFPL